MKPVSDETRRRMSESQRRAWANRHRLMEAGVRAADRRRGFATIMVDGDRVTPGSEACRCTPECEFPCWQRLGIAPPCDTCGCPFAPAEETKP